MILGLDGHVEPWTAQALPLGAAFPPLHPCWKACFKKHQKFGYLCTIY